MGVGANNPAPLFKGRLMKLYLSPEYLREHGLYLSALGLVYERDKHSLKNELLKVAENKSFYDFTLSLFENEVSFSIDEFFGITFYKEKL